MRQAGIKPGEFRDRLATVAREHFGGASQEAALNQLIDEHEMRQVPAAYA